MCLCCRYPQSSSFFFQERSQIFGCSLYFIYDAQVLEYTPIISVVLILNQAGNYYMFVWDCSKKNITKHACNIFICLTAFYTLLCILSCNIKESYPYIFDSSYIKIKIKRNNNLDILKYINSHKKWFWVCKSFIHVGTWQYNYRISLTIFSLQQHCSTNRISYLFKNT